MVNILTQYGLVCLSSFYCTFKVAVYQLAHSHNTSGSHVVFI